MMSSSIAGLTQIFATTISLVYIYSLFETYIMPMTGKYYGYILGIVFGMFAAINLVARIEVYPGVIFDGRTILIALSTFFGGWESGIVTALIFSIARFSLGGIGMWVGVVSPFMFVLTTAGFRRYWKHQKIGTHHLLVLSVVLLLQAYLNILFIPDAELRANTFGKMVPALAIFIPLGTLVTGYMLLLQRQHLSVQRALKESEDLYRSMIMALSEGVILQTSDGNIKMANKAAQHILGLSADQIIGHTWLDSHLQAIDEDGTSFHGETHPAMIAQKTGQPQSQVSMGVHRPDGSLYWVEVNAQPVFHRSTAQPDMVITTLTDVTERKLSQKQIIQERDLLRTLIDNLPDHIFIKDTQGRFVESNAAHRKVIQTMGGIEEVIGKTAFEVFPQGIAAQYHEDDQSVLESGKPMINVERTGLNAEGHPSTFLSTKVPLRDAQNRIIGVISISRDISERKQLEQQKLELVTARERSRVLQHFVADMSHDFRNPLTIIDTSLYLFQKHVEDAQYRRYLDTIQAQSFRIQHLLADLLEMAKLERDDFAYHFEQTNLVPLLSEAISDFRTLAEERNHTLEFEVMVKNIEVSVDPGHLRRVFNNLLENAIHYTPNGGFLNVRVEKEVNNCVIHFQDNGIGISEADQEHIFDTFFRADEARSADKGGSGLGLSIVKKIIEVHQGSIEVVSQLGQGTTFIIRLPIISNNTPLS